MECVYHRIRSRLLNDDCCLSDFFYCCCLFVWMKSSNNHKTTKYTHFYYKGSFQLFLLCGQTWNFWWAWTDRCQVQFYNVCYLLSHSYIASNLLKHPIYCMCVRQVCILFGFTTKKKKKIIASSQQNSCSTCCSRNLSMDTTIKHTLEKRKYSR